MEMATAPRFKVIEGWEKLPAGYVHKDVDGVAVDSKDNVYLMTRQDARLIVYDREGNFLRSWGEGLFTQRTHGVAIGPDDMVYAVDDGDHTVRKFTPEGKQVMMIGVSGKPSDTGLRRKDPRQRPARRTALQPADRCRHRPQRGDLRLRRLRQRPGAPLHPRREADPVLGGTGVGTRPVPPAARDRGLAG